MVASFTNDGRRHRGQGGGNVAAAATATGAAAVVGHGGVGGRGQPLTRHLCCSPCPHSRACCVFCRAPLFFPLSHSDSIPACIIDQLSGRKLCADAVLGAEISTSNELPTTATSVNCTCSSLIGEKNPNQLFFLGSHSSVG